MERSTANSNSRHLSSPLALFQGSCTNNKQTTNGKQVCASPIPTTSRSLSVRLCDEERRTLILSSSAAALIPAARSPKFRPWAVGTFWHSLVLVLVTVLLCAEYHNVVLSTVLLRTWNYCGSTTASDDAKTGTTQDDWRIVVTSNFAFEKEFLNWWYHANRTGLFSDDTSLVVYADDPKMYDKYAGSSKMQVKKAWEAGTRFQDIELTQSDKFVIGQPGFNELVSRRPSILLQELYSGGPNVLYMDLDVFLLQDPRSLFLGDYDFWAAEANNRAQKSSQHWVINSGFLALRPTTSTIECLTRWKNKLQESKVAVTNQGPLNEVVTRMETERQLRVKLLLSRVFPVGKMYRDQDNGNLTALDKDVVAFHNNFCSTSKTCKIDRAKALGLWNEMDSSELL